tara:strand:- start:701 stop:2350 length:1650 start_codon:yes stop_codon:yes gene_type:complete
MNSNSFIESKKTILSLFKGKKFTKVIKLGKKLLKKNSQDSDLLYILGLSSVNLKNYTEAENFFKKLLIFKKNDEIFYIYGNINSKLKNYEIAINSFNQAISLNPKFSEAYNNLGNVKKLTNNIEDAIKNYKKAISIKKDNLTALLNLAVVYREERKYFESKDVYKKILELDNNNLTAKHDLGSINTILGDFKLARKYYKEVLKEDKKNFKSYKNYIEITKIDEKDDIFKTLENVSTDNINDQNKVDMFHSLSKGYFDQNKKQLGLKFLEKGKTIKKQYSNFSIKREKKIFNNLKDYFENNYSKEIKYQKKINKIPIFILGMPRSGTTLIERILSTHSKIYGAGELIFFPQIVNKNYIKNSKNFDDTLSKIRTEYSDQIIKLPNNNRYIIDKLPLNFKWIGFIIKALPEAKIIHLERNAMAVCWSNYRINFRDTGMEMALSQRDIAEYYALYDDLMKFWFKKFNKKIINVNYEKFVSDHVTETKNLIHKLNLDWEEGLKDYNKNNDKPVETASLHQVRGKIVKNTSEQWKIYKDYLIDMQNTLKSYEIDF